MSSFALKQQKAILQHVNLRKEGKEDNRVPACDLKFQCTAPSDILLAFHPTLRVMLFDRNEGSPRYPRMGPIDWDAELRNYLLDITVPPRRKPVELTGVKLKNFSFRPMTNWRLDLIFSAQAYPANGEAIADQLHRALLEDVVLDLRLNGDLLAGAEERVEEAVHKSAQRLHEMGLDDETTISVPGGPSVTLGALTDAILEKVKAAGKAVGQNGDDLEGGMDQCWKDMGFAAAFVEEHLADLQRVFTDGYEEGGG